MCNTNFSHYFIFSQNSTLVLTDFFLNIDADYILCILILQYLKYQFRYHYLNASWTTTAHTTKHAVTNNASIHASKTRLARSAHSVLSTDIRQFASVLQGTREIR